MKNDRLDIRSDNFFNFMLKGCFPYFRSDRELCAALGKRGQAPVSVEQGITLSHQLGCVMYVETTSRFNRQSVLSAFEIAALAALGQITPKVGLTEVNS